MTDSKVKLVLEQELKHLEAMKLSGMQFEAYKLQLGILLLNNADTTQEGVKNEKYQL